MSDAIDDAPLLDGARLDELRLVLGNKQTVVLLTALADELASRPQRIAEAVAGSDPVAARAAAHLFKGAALTVGAERVARIAHALEMAPETAQAALVARLCACAALTAAEVAHHAGWLAPVA